MEKISDTNYIWFPYLFLKPLPSEKISIIKSTLVMPPLWGIYMGYPTGFTFFFSEGWGERELIVYVGKFTLFFVIWFNIVTRPLWNLRADRSKNKRC